MKPKKFKDNRFVQLFVVLFRVNTRNRLAFFFSLMFPLIFMGIFGIAFQEGDPTNTTIEVGIINNDTGVPAGLTVPGADGKALENHDITQVYLEILEEITFEDGETRIMHLNYYTQEATATQDLERQQIKALLVIPEDFSLGFMASIRKNSEIIGYSGNWQGYPEIGYTTSIEILGDSSLIQFNIASTVIREVTTQYFELNTDPSVQITISSSMETEGLTTFDYLVPGLVIFSIISNANTVAAVSLADVETGMINRLRLTRMNKLEYPTAMVLSQMLFAFIQIPILFGTAVLFGFPINSGVMIAFVFAIFVSAAMSGIGMFIASSASNAEVIGPLASIITTPMSFLAGAFFPIPNSVLFSIDSMGVEFGIFDILPPTRAIDALRLLIFNDYQLIDILPDLIITIVLSILYLSLGVFAYSRKHLRTR